MSVFLADEQEEAIEDTELRDLAELVLEQEGYPPESEVTILVVADEEMAGYNERFLQRTGPTDVLAFPLEDLTPGEVPSVDPDGPPILVGDVIIAPAYVRRQAMELGVDFEDEMALMVVHGVLHLLGYDHQTDEDAAVMEGRERVILAAAGRSRR